MIIVLSIIFLFFFVLRFLHLSESINFGSDAARDFLVTWQMFADKHPLLIGPPSEYAINGRQFFFGPAPYYFILPALLIGNWEPLVVSYYLIVLNAAVLLTAVLILNKFIKEKLIIYFFALFCAVTPAFIQYAQSYWNPYFMLPISMLLLVHLVASKDKRSNALLFFSITGFLFGLGLQFHYSFIFAIIISMLWLWKQKKLHLVTLAAIFGGFILGFLPMIIFELRNQFYNVNTFWLVLTNSGAIHSEFKFASFYLISLLPFLFFFAAVLLAKIYKKNQLLAYALCGMYFIWSLSLILPTSKYPLPYPILQQIAKSIQADNPTNFNIVDQLTRDNQAAALRYILTVHGFAPQAVDQYQSSQSLYIYSKEPLNNLLKNPVYEINSFLPFKKISSRKMENDIVIYKLDK